METKTQHTQGPWGSYRFGIFPIHENARPARGRSDGLIATTAGFGVPDGEALKNAALIAAAPELLAAAREVLSAWDSLPGKDAPMIGRLRAAIQKAEGGN